MTQDDAAKSRYHAIPDDYFAGLNRSLEARVVSVVDYRESIAT